LAILHNITLFAREVLLKLLEGKPYIIHWHDWPCRHRLFFPAVPRCKSCPDKPFWSRLISGAKANFFLSPLHHRYMAELYPEVDQNPHELVPSAMDPEPFKSVAARQQNVSSDDKSALGVNCLYEFKGKQNVVKYAREHPDMQFTFIGENDGLTNSMPRNCQYVGPRPYREMPQWYGSHEYFIHLPSTPQPFERTYAEAVLAGRKLIVNKLVGALSWGWRSREELEKAVSSAPATFFEKLEALLS